MKLSRIELLAWAGGLFEGEGCVVSSGRRLGLNVASTDRDVIETFVALFGGRINERPRQTPHKTLYYWEVFGFDALAAALALRPYLHARRAAAVEQLLATAEQLYHERACHTCGLVFKPRRHNQVCCSDPCKRADKTRQGRAWKLARREGVVLG